MKARDRKAKPIPSQREQKFCSRCGARPKEADLIMAAFDACGIRWQCRLRSSCADRCRKAGQ